MTTYTVTVTPVDHFSSHSKIRFGVGEHLELTVTAKPAPPHPQALTWQVKKGSAVVQNHPVRAGVQPGSALVKCGDREGELVLDLVNVNREVLASKRLNVVAPDGAKYFRRNLPPALIGWIGFEGWVFLEPHDVSFKWVQIREGATTSEGTGCLASRPNQTVFESRHPLGESWTSCGGLLDGNKLLGSDIVGIRLHQHEIGRVGEKLWHIPWSYRVEGHKNATRFMTARHHVKMDAQQVSISKLNVRVTHPLTH